MPHIGVRLGETARYWTTFDYKCAVKVAKFCSCYCEENNFTVIRTSSCRSICCFIIFLIHVVKSKAITICIVKHLCNFAVEILIIIILIILIIIIIIIIIMALSCELIYLTALFKFESKNPLAYRWHVSLWLSAAHYISFLYNRFPDKCGFFFTIWLFCRQITLCYSKIGFSRKYL